MTDTRHALAAPTEAQVLAAARMLCKIHAGQCQVDEDDTWKVYGEQFKDDARDALIAALSAQRVAGAVATEPSEEIQELRAQVEAWRKQCETLTNQVICCGVAARHPDATLTTRGAYAGKWNSPQAEEVRKLRAERDALLAASPQPEPSAQGEPVACQWCCGTGRFADHDCRFCAGKGSGSAFASTPPTPPHAVVEAVPLNFDQLQKVMSKHFGGRELTDDEADSAEAFARAIERAHGIAPAVAARVVTNVGAKAPT